MNMQCQKGGPPCAGHRVASADVNAGITQSTSTVSAGGVAFGTADRPISGTVIRKNPHAFALRFEHRDGTRITRTKHASPRFSYWQ